MTNSVAAELMNALYGMDVYRDFKPTVPEDLQGWNSGSPAFERIIAEVRPAIIVDVGVWKGRSSVFLASLLKKYNIEGAVISVDTFLGSPEHWNRARPDNIFDSLKIQHGYPHLYWTFLSNVVHRGLTDYIVPLPQTSDNASKILARLKVKIGLAHIDAAHDYESCLRDATSFWNLVAPGYYLIGDDYSPAYQKGVVRAADEFAQSLGQKLEVEGPKWILRKKAA